MAKLASHYQYIFLQNSRKRYPINRQASGAHFSGGCWISQHARWISHNDDFRFRLSQVVHVRAFLLQFIRSRQVIISSLSFLVSSTYNVRLVLIMVSPALEDLFDNFAPPIKKAKEVKRLTTKPQKVKPQLSCELCPYKTTVKQCLKSHQVIHSDIAKRPHKCYDCPSAFPTASALTKHEQSLHNITKETLKCYDPDCEFETDKLSKLARHHMTHDPHKATKAKPWKCTHKYRNCPATFRTVSELRKHESTCLNEGEW